MYLSNPRELCLGITVTLPHVPMSPNKLHSPLGKAHHDLASFALSVPLIKKMAQPRAGCGACLPSPNPISHSDSLINLLLLFPRHPGSARLGSGMWGNLAESTSVRIAEWRKGSSRLWGDYICIYRALPLQRSRHT